jgi:hypothetical protein
VVLSKRCCRDHPIGGVVRLRIEAMPRACS